MNGEFDAAAVPGADQPDEAAADESTSTGADGEPGDATPGGVDRGTGGTGPGDEVLDLAAPAVSAEVAPVADGDADAVGDDAGPAGDATVTVEGLLDDLDRVTGERDTHLADLQRVTAEFANFRRQTEKRVGDLVHRAVSRLVGELLPVLDACDAAAEHGVEGIEPVKAALLGVLEREGLEVIGKPGEPFDPTRHEAVAHEPDGGDEGPTVVEVLRAGYALNGRVVRPAMVRVRG